jgi:hypothetical protein
VVRVEHAAAVRRNGGQSCFLHGTLNHVRNFTQFVYANSAIGVTTATVVWAG